MREFVSHTRPGTGVYSKGSERILSILEAARDLLMRDGYHRLTMRKIAQTCGITVGNLNYYYATKANLLKNLLEMVIQGYTQEFDRIRSAHPDAPRQQLAGIIRFILDDLGTQETTRFFPELWALANHDEHAAALMEDLYSEARAVFIDLIGQINPTLNRRQIRQTALFLSASLEGHTMFVGYEKPWQKQIRPLKNIAVKGLVELVETLRPEDFNAPSI